MHLKRGVLGIVAEARQGFLLIIDFMALPSKRKTQMCVIVALLIVAILADNSQGIMGWFGNSGKRPNGRRSIIKV